jgi:hypothetical protein
MTLSIYVAEEKYNGKLWSHQPNGNMSLVGQDHTIHVNS